jgi:hypothetical protein
MWNTLKTGIALVVIMLLGVFTAWMAGHAFRLMSDYSDFLVLVGVDLLLFLFLFWILLTWSSIHAFGKWWRSRKTRVGLPVVVEKWIARLEQRPVFQGSRPGTVRALRRHPSASV